MSDDLVQLVPVDNQTPDPVFISWSIAGPSHSPLGDSFESSVHDSITPTALPLYHSHTFLIGIFGLLVGFVTAAAGGFEMFIFPILCLPPPPRVQWPALDNFFGFAIYAGVIQVCNGATGIRATITNRRATIHRLFAIHLLSLSMYIIAAIFVVISFSRGLSFHTTGCELIGHSFSAGFICLGFVWQILTLLFTYETVYDGRTTSFIQLILVSLINKVSPPVPHDVRMEVREASRAAVVPG